MLLAVGRCTENPKIAVSVDGGNGYTVNAQTANWELTRNGRNFSYFPRTQMQRLWWRIEHARIESQHLRSTESLSAQAHANNNTEYGARSTQRIETMKKNSIFFQMRQMVRRRRWWNFSRVNLFVRRPRPNTHTHNYLDYSLARIENIAIHHSTDDCFGKWNISLWPARSPSETDRDRWTLDHLHALSRWRYCFTIWCDHYKIYRAIDSSRTDARNTRPDTRNEWIYDRHSDAELSQNHTVQLLSHPVYPVNTMWLIPYCSAEPKHVFISHLNRLI